MGLLIDAKGSGLQLNLALQSVKQCDSDAVLLASSPPVTFEIGSEEGLPGLSYWQPIRVATPSHPTTVTIVFVPLLAVRVK